MVVIDKLTVGQTTFILRVAIQIISYGSLFLIGLLILGSTPRVASVKTHSLLNRVVGKSTITTASMKWVWDCIRGRNSSPSRHTRLLMAIALLTLYELFTSLSDIGFLGFYACSVPGPSFHDYPASISTDQLARSTILANLDNGTDPNTLSATRCDSIVAVDLGPAGSGWTCDALHISTWANASFFAGLNMTDSDALMPRQLAQYKNLISSFIGPGNSRVESPTVSGGMALNPHATGFQAVFGVPQLAPQRKVTLEKTMAFEFEMGCMTLGISSRESLNDVDPQITIFQTNGTWRQYTGPDYLRDVLSQATDAIRQYLIPSFNKSSLASDGSMVMLNSSLLFGGILSNMPHVTYLDLPDVGKSDGVTVEKYIFGNCTNALTQQLNLTVIDPSDMAPLCAMYGVGGLDGQEFKTEIEMVCATASQVNMVSATIQTDVQNAVSVELTHLPSDLNYLRSSNYWNSTLTNSNDSVTFASYPIERYTLSDNPDGLSTHFIVSYGLYFGTDQQIGAGSGGTSFAWVGSFITSSVNSFPSTDNNLLILDQGLSQITFNATTVTEWGGQAGASFMLATTMYNGWAARDSAPMVVLSTGGNIATCYHMLYAIGFLPLVLSTLFVIGWSAFMAFTSGFRGSTHLGQLYGGINPYRAAVCPNLAPKKTLLIWENKPKPHLEVVSPEEHLAMNDRHVGQGSAQGYLQAGSREDQNGTSS
jgi:hypothetical protein